MFDISWGEIAVISAVGIALLGRKDLPPASHALGYHVGRIVGLLRGARVRAIGIPQIIPYVIYRMNLRVDYGS
jgi:ribose/xylose/arabinose/galactoside ABC-type transport system permease subunit